MQNAPATAAYKLRIASGCLPGARGFQLTQADHLRARAIERLMCTFRLDLGDLRPEFRRCVEGLISQLSEIADRFAPFVQKDGSRVAILPEGRPLTRIIVSVFDQHVPEGVRYSRAS